MAESLLNVTGMTCQGCVRHVDAAVRKVDGVTAVEVALEGGRLRVTHDVERAPVAAIEAAVSGAGYTAQLVGG